MSQSPTVNPVNPVNEVNQVPPWSRAGTLLTLLTGLTLLTLAAPAGALTIMQSSFTGGELSPLAAARLDAQRYYQSLATLDNMVAIPQGPAVRRPGTIFAGATDSNNVARLLPFRYSTTDAYVLEFTPAKMRVFRSHGLVTNDDGSLYTLATPFDANELAHVQLGQSADVCYLVDGTDWPQKLVRTDHNDWDLTPADIHDGPFLTENLTGTTIAAAATTGTDVNLVASAAVFQSGHVGSYWRLRDLVPIQTTSGTMSALTDANHPVGTVPCQAGNKFQWDVHGTFVGKVDLQMSYDSGSTWTSYATVSSTSSAQTPDQVYDNDTGQDVLLRAACVEYTSGTAAYTVWAHAYLHTGVVKIVDYNDPCHVTCDVVRTLAATRATVRWSEGAWSVVRGYPRAIAWYNDRLVLAGTAYQPLRLWFSATGDWENFDEGEALDSDSFGYTLGQSEQDPILWVASQRQKGLILGTTGSVMEIQALDSTQGIKPGNPPTVTGALTLPCADVPPVQADNILLVLQRGGRKLHEMLYSYDADALVAPDLTLFAEHITAGGITQMAWATQPYTILWCVRADGTLLAFTYDRNYQIVSWSTHALGGSGVVESCAVIPGALEDELWLSVRRTVDSNTVRYVEYLAPWDWGTDQNDVHFVDCGLVYDGAAVTALTGLTHLTGCSVSVYADGAALADQTVSSSGGITLDYAAACVHVGLPYTSTLRTLRYDVTGAQGTTWARSKKIDSAVVSFYRTLGAGVGPDADHLTVPDFRDPEAVMYAGAAPLFSGDTLPITLAGSGFRSDSAQVVIQQTRPWPLTVRAIVAEVSVR